MPHSNRDTMTAAMDYLAAGLSVIPIRTGGSKAPALHANHDVLGRRRRAEEEEMQDWFMARGYGIGIQCGEVSGDLEVLDIEEEALLTPILDKARGIAGGQLADKLCCVRTPRPGWHIYYRCESPVGSGRVLDAHLHFANDSTQSLLGSPLRLSLDHPG